MPRRAPTDHEGAIHHVTTRGVDGHPVFEVDRARVDFLDHLDDTCFETGTELLWWALQINHPHLLLRTGATPLWKVMHRLLARPARRYNQDVERRGYVFQGRYRAVPVATLAHLHAEIRYIALNPVRAGVVRSISDLATYPWTAYGQLHRGDPTPRLASKLVLGLYDSNAVRALARIETVLRAAVEVQADDAVTLALREATLGHSDPTRGPALVHLANLGVRQLGMSARETARVIGVHHSAVMRALVPG